MYRHLLAALLVGISSLFCKEYESATDIVGADEIDVYSYTVDASPLPGATPQQPATPQPPDSPTEELETAILSPDVTAENPSFFVAMKEASSEICPVICLISMIIFILTCILLILYLA